MKVYLDIDVLSAARARIRRILRNFDVVLVNVSGGKDSTVVLNLTLEAAEELGRLPVPVVFIDQEAEWQSTIDMISEIMHDPRVDPYWFQIPIRIFNATSHNQQWLNCWGEGEHWIREKDPISIHENILGTDRFFEAFDTIPAVYFPGKTVATIAGVRAEESPARFSGLTAYPAWRDITWGSISGKKQNGSVAFYPLYDWSYVDIWKAIHDHGWPYSRLYDEMYRYGVPVKNMRVSNVHHETATKSLTYMQEVEPETWNAVTARVSGVNAVNILQDDWVCPKELPWMFSSWQEYRDHLLDNLITDPEHHAIFKKHIASTERTYFPEVQEDACKMHISAILTNDYHGTKLKVFHASHGAYSRGRGRNGGGRALTIK